MHRRDVNRTLLGAGLLASGLNVPGPGHANPLGDDGPRDIVAGRVILRIAAAQVALTWLLVMSSRAALGLDLRQPMPQFNENRAGLGGMLSGLTRPLLQDRLLAAQMIGWLVLHRSLLVLLPTSPGFRPPPKTIIAHRDLSWEPPRARPVSMRDLPTMAALFAEPRIGKAYLADRTLIVMVPPTRATEPQD